MRLPILTYVYDRKGVATKSHTGVVELSYREESVFRSIGTNFELIQAQRYSILVKKEKKSLFFARFALTLQPK